MASDEAVAVAVEARVDVLCADRGTGRAFTLGMAFWLKLLLWTGVLVLPGGLLLLPLIYGLHRHEARLAEEPGEPEAA